MVEKHSLSTRMQFGAPPAPGHSVGQRLDPRLLLSHCGNKVDFEHLSQFAGRSILSPAELSRRDILEFARFAALLELTEIASHHPLDGKIAITAFFEASTRTRLSFESAVLRLDGKILSVPDGRVTGIAKGESLSDIGEMFNSYGDVVIMRHPETSSIECLRKNLRVPLINAGNGSGEHPTQALADWYTLLKWKPELALDELPESERLHLGIVGTPGNMRAVKSFLRMALAFVPALAKVTVVSEMVDPLGPELRQAVESSELRLETCDDLTQILPDLDVIYMNSIALLGDSYQLLNSRFQVNAASAFKPSAVIMHPLARRDELSPELDDTKHNLYFAQAAGAVYIRQAILIAVLDRLGALPTSVLYLAS